VLWGLYHGLLLLLHAQIGARVRAKLPDRAWVRFGSWLLCFHLVAFGWILFRAKGLDQFAIVVRSIAHDLYAGLFLAGHGPSTEQVGFIAAMFGFIGLSAIERRHRLLARIWASSLASVVFAAVLIVAMLLLALPDGPAFIYFQF
jgi:hypothetical protein